MTYSFKVLTPSNVEANWLLVSKLLDPVAPFCLGDYDIEDMLPMIKNREAFAMGLYRGEELVLVAVAKVCVYPGHNIMHILALGGRGVDYTLKRFQEQISDIGRKLEVVAIRGVARPAMERFWRRFAPEAKPLGTVMEHKI